MGNNETTPKTGMVLQAEETDCFSLVLHWARVTELTD